MNRTDLEQVSAALELLRASQCRAECGLARPYDDTSLPRELLCDVLRRNGVTTATAATRKTLGSIDARRNRMLAQLEDGLAALLDAGVIARVAA